MVLMIVSTLRVSDAHFVDFLGRGVFGSKGDDPDGKSGKLHLNNCTFVSEIETDKQTIYSTDFVDVIMNNVKVHTNSFGGGVKIEVFKRAAIDGLDIITPGNGLEIKGLQKDGFFGGDYFARNIVIDVESEGFLSSFCDGKSILENFSIKSKGLGWRISGVKYFTANNGNITDVDNHGAYIIFKDFSKIAKAGEDNYFHLDISNVAFVNWGLGSKFYQNAILFSVDNEVDGTINGLRLQNISLIIEDGKQTNQIGLDWSPFDNNKLGDSWLDGISFVNVPIPINEVSGKGEGLVERYIGVQ